MKAGEKNRSEVNQYKFGHYTLDAERTTLRNNDTNTLQTLTVRDGNTRHIGREQGGDGAKTGYTNPLLGYGK